MRTYNGNNKASPIKHCVLSTLPYLENVKPFLSEFPVLYLRHFAAKYTLFCYGLGNGMQYVNTGNQQNVITQPQPTSMFNLTSSELYQLAILKHWCKCVVQVWL
jgi:hypothetical protein